MTTTFQKVLPPAGLLSDDDVLPQLQSWQAMGQRTALVTLVGVEGGAPRQPGAQMAVAEDGSYAGYLSGGCLEQVVVFEAQAVIKEGRNRLVRYGKGSPYFDVKLACGGGLDVYFDQAIGPALVSDVLERRSQRQTCILRTNLATGASTVASLETGATSHQGILRDGVFERNYPGRLRLVLLGSGPALTGMAALATATGIELSIPAGDDLTRAEIIAAGLGDRLAGGIPFDTLERLDEATAAVLYFHAHDQEPDLLFQILKSKCFYIGALGNHAVHRERLAVLAARGCSPTDLARIRAPVGLIAGAKSTATLAVGVLAELMIEAKALNYVA